MTRVPFSRSARRIVAVCGIGSLLGSDSVARSGCATPEASIRNPLITGGALTPSRIAKSHSWAKAITDSRQDR